MQTLQEVEKEYKKGIILKAVNTDKKIIGSVRGYLESGTAYIGKLFVHPNEQGKGIGTNLLIKIEKNFTKMRYELFTSTKSIKNISLYERQRYKVYTKKMITDELEFVYFEKM